MVSARKLLLFAHIRGTYTWFGNSGYYVDDGMLSGLNFLSASRVETRNVSVDDQDSRRDLDEAIHVSVKCITSECAY